MRGMLRQLVIATALLGGCRTSQGVAPAAEAARAPEPRVDCGPAIPGMEQLLKPAAFVILGELHGTQESPAFATQLACHAATAGHPVRLALEIPLEEQPRIDAFLASEDGATQALTASGFWSREYQDGRSSEAMLQALVRARELRRAGLPLQVVTFDDGAKPRDAGLAEQLRQARAKAPKDTFIVLVGNLHARRDVGAPWDPKLQFMANRLLAAEPGLVALDVVNAGGAAWICRGMTADTCKVQPLKGRGPAAAPGITLQKIAGDEEGYDGSYSVGELHASPPALPAATAVPAPQ